MVKGRFQQPERLQRLACHLRIAVPVGDPAV